MGNCTSSCFLVNSSCKAKLINGNGNLRKVKVPIKAAEVMLEETGHVISPVDDLIKTQRISALRADDDLLAGKVYLLVPVSRVNGKVTREEITMIESACDEKKSLKKNRKRSGSKVLPSVNDQKIEQEKEKEDDHGMFLGEQDTRFEGYLFGKHKQWLPVLETISEVY